MTLNPNSVLDRGYSITKDRHTGKYISEIQTIQLEQSIDVIMSDGSLTCKVKGKNNAKKNI